MAFRRKQSLSDWIQEALTDPDKSGKCTAMSLCHMVGETQHELHSVTFGSTPWEPSKLASLFQGKAESFSQDLPGAQTFVLLAMYEGSSEPQAKHPIMIAGNSDFDGLLTEGPHEKGLLQQMMRHNEAIVGAAFLHNRVLFEQSAKMLETLGEQNHRLMNENHEAIGAIKELLMAEATKAHEYKMTEIKEQRSTQERNKLLGMAPALLNTILGKEVFPQESADSAIMDTLAENLTQEEIMTLSRTLRPEIWGPLAARLGTALERKEKIRATGTEILLHKDAVDDASGD